MNEVFEKTRELAGAIMRSEEYTAMKAAEDVAMANEEAAAIMAQYIERKQRLEDAMTQENPDREVMSRLSDEMDALQKQLQNTDDIVRLTAARNAFTGLINQVNQVLRFTITGEMGDADGEEGGSGCTGSCATCPGCH